METKKTKKASLEKGKSLSFLMGMVVALAVLFTAFEWGDKEHEFRTSNRPVDPFGTGLPPIAPTRQEPPVTPAPEEVIKTPEIIKIVETIVKPVIIASTEGNIKIPQPEIYKPRIETPPEVINYDDIIFVAVEENPIFPGDGDSNSNFMKWIAENIKYPPVAAENGIQGRVHCQFIVNADGSVSDVTILRSIDPSLDREAVRVLRSMPRWKPGKQQHKAVRVKLSVPVNFRLNK
jgi:TonB family C-terminal domain